MLQILQNSLHIKKINQIFNNKLPSIHIYLKRNQNCIPQTTVNNQIVKGTTIVVGRQQKQKYLRKISVNLPFQLFSSISVFSYNLTRHNSSSSATEPALKKRKMAKLTEIERTEKLQPLLNAGWTMVKDRDAIYKEYLFKDFNEAFSFMTSIAMIAEKLNHHPEWFNVYNKVQITMSTHDVNGLSAKDIKVANFMEQQAKKLL